MDNLVPSIWERPFCLITVLVLLKRVLGFASSAVLVMQAREIGSRINKKLNLFHDFI
jgi:hypothetical protein